MTNEERSQAIADIRRMKAEYMNGRKMDEVTERKCKSFDIALKAIEQTTWILCSEKMPPIAQRVLVSANNGEVFIARFHSVNKWTFEPTGIGYAYGKDNVTAWMPLPPSYQGE